MGENGRDCTILLVDIVSSMLLYQRSGDDAAARQISERIGWLKQLIDTAGGSFVHSRGDDVLATFDDPVSALHVIMEILRPSVAIQMKFRVGIHYGPVIRAGDDVFGDAVNLTARFAATANPGEAIIGQDFVNRLPPPSRTWLRYLDEMTFKGKPEPQRVFTLAAPDQTEILQDTTVRAFAGDRYKRAVQVSLVHGDRTITIGEAESASLGRSPGCDIVIDRKWVSRLHATIKLVDGRVRLAEQSTSGTFISMQHAQEVFTRREDVLLVGSGNISPGLKLTSPEAQVIHFAISY